MKRHTLLFVIATLNNCGSNASAPIKQDTTTISSVSNDSQIQSNDILNRDAQSNFTKVKHILISWNKNDEKTHPHAVNRDKNSAEKLAKELLARLHSGENIEPLMAQYSEDPGSSQTGISYDVKPDAALVFEFKRMGLRLKQGESGLVLSDFGWHVMQRVE